MSSVGAEIGCDLLPRWALGVAEEPLPEGLLHLCGLHPLEGVDSDQSFNHMLGLIRDVLVDVLKLSLFNLLKEVVLALGSEGVVALQDNEKEHPQAPQIGVDGHVVSFGDDLRSHVSGSPTEGVDSIGWL